MKKYQYKESRNFARILGMTNAVMVRQECIAKYFHKPLRRIKNWTQFLSIMLKLRWTLEKGRQIDFFSKADYTKLKSMWQIILRRKYEPTR